MTPTPAGPGRQPSVAVLLLLALLALTVLIAAVIAVAIADHAGDPLPPAGPAKSSPGKITTSPTATAPPTRSPEPIPPPVVVPPEPAPTPDPTPGPEPEPAPLPSVPFPSSLRGQDLSVIPGAGSVVALTFDAGADPEGLPKTLSATGCAVTAMNDLGYVAVRWSADTPGWVG